MIKKREGMMSSVTEGSYVGDFQKYWAYRSLYGVSFVYEMYGYSE
jgi:hypothetical protein